MLYAFVLISEITFFKFCIYFIQVIRSIDCKCLRILQKFECTKICANEYDMQKSIKYTNKHLQSNVIFLLLILKFFFFFFFKRETC